ncbi:MAG: aminodeoxychorismate synthase component I [Verrucomicrobiales bacterium]|nr:aminodeoxychorismate synthase component I [Verrucomicrobiales bacterium]
MPKTSNRTPVSVELDATPVQVARGLRHLPSLVFLDSSSAETGDFRKDAALSIVAAQPAEVLTGNLFSEVDHGIIRAAVERYQVELPDFGFPCGGLIGGIDYDGKFEFGVFPEMLIFDHARETWFEIGDLSREIDCAAELENFSAPRFDFTGQMDRDSFCEIVSQAQEYIAAGDIYQVNLAHRLHTAWEQKSEPFALYERFREASPAPFAAFLNLDNRTVLSTSPEQFLRMSGSHIQTRPIKGTRPRFRDRAKDEKSAYDLKTSPKEIAELIMITDLERNDLGQICEFGSVEASELLKLERYEQVFHLVSTVEGQLRPEIDHLAALAACFPGGSITGAPKKRAREIIDELEPEDRGLYTGSIGIFGFNGESRFNIAIRTALIEQSELHFHVGAGIVADSDPEMEWEETLHKAAGILRACEG